MANPADFQVRYVNYCEKVYMIKKLSSSYEYSISGTELLSAYKFASLSYFQIYRTSRRPTGIHRFSHRYHHPCEQRHDLNSW